MNTEQHLSKHLLYLTVGTAVILLIPFTAMQFTSEVMWTLSDFIFAGILILGTGYTYLLVTRKSGSSAYRAAIGLALGTGFVLIWSNLAVGIIGSEDNPINVWYFGVIAIGIIGSVISRFKAEGMVITLFVAAFAQALIAAIAIFGGYYQSPPSSVLEILGVNGFFVTLWIVSALMFKYAAQKEAEDHQSE
ncbi:hypothetical protein [Gracilimonas sediminicola]|uniref:Uncharacterized protein n=1 Tax=Gracilimonas sediminicola TaxID=2952158 RepID=A0A9X2RCH3_9BACT|nr:hypothetical protein [Gracilimonas sediminicola]MCP9290801.1 hypothetical protein [Gracilimonas sediminicola]